MDKDFPPKFEVGDLVQGHYEFIEQYYWYEPPDYDGFTHTGVVVEISYEPEYFTDYIYTILCLDGTKRFFTETELTRM